jgi:hypothetical protein
MVRLHRSVVLPEFQGFGLSMKMTEVICKMYHDKGLRVRSTTNHPARIAGFKKSPNWICVHKGRQPSNSKSGLNVGGNSDKRITTSWEYCPRKAGW